MRSWANRISRPAQLLRLLTVFPRKKKLGKPISEISRKKLVGSTNREVRQTGCYNLRNFSTLWPILLWETEVRQTAQLLLRNFFFACKRGAKESCAANSLPPQRGRVVLNFTSPRGYT